MRYKVISAMVLSFLGVLSTSALAGILVEAGMVFGTPGDGITIPIYISGIPEEGISYFSFEFLYEAGALSYENIHSHDLPGDLIGIDSEPGVLKIIWFNYPPYTNDTASIDLTFMVVECLDFYLIIDESSFEGDLVGAIGGDGYFDCPCNYCLMSIEPYSYTFCRVGETLQLQAYCSGEGCSNKFVYLSNNPEIATVNLNGLVTSVSFGTCEIIVYDSGCGDGYGVFCNITVEPCLDCFVDVEPNFLCCNEAPTYQLTAECYGEGCSGEFVWGSSNSDFVMVDQNGLVNCQEEGDAYIYVYDKSCGSSFSDYCLVYENCPNSCVITGIDPIGTQTDPVEVNIGDTFTFTAGVEGDCTEANLMWMGLETTMPPTQTDNIAWQDLGNHQCAVRGMSMGPCAIAYIDMDNPKYNYAYSILNVCACLCIVTVSPPSWTGCVGESTIFTGYYDDYCQGPFAWTTNPPNTNVVYLVDNGDNTATVTVANVGECEVCYGSVSDQVYDCSTITALAKPTKNVTNGIF